MKKRIRTGGRKRTRAQRERDLTLVADMLAKKATYQEIAFAVNSRYEEFDLSERTIANDVKAVIARWRENTFKSVSSHLAAQLAGLDAQIRALWESWNRSIGDHEETITESVEDSYSGAQQQTYSREKSRRKKTARHGDLRIMAELSRVMEQRAKLLGLNALTQARIDWRQEARRIGIDSDIAQSQFAEMVEAFSAQIVSDAKNWDDEQLNEFLFGSEDE